MKLLITGASGGIGGAAVERAIAEGHQVTAHGQNHTRLASLAPLGADIVTSDLSTEQGMDSLKAQLADSTFDAVIAAQGVPGAGAIEVFTETEIRRIMEVNFRSVMRLFARLRGNVLQPGSRYVVVASQASLRAERFDAVYCASKWAALAWAKTQNEIEGPSGIRIRSLCPGRTITPLFDESMAAFAKSSGQSLECFTEEILGQIPLRRFATATETAGSALFLASPDPRPSVLAQTGGEVPF